MAPARAYRDAPREALALRWRDIDFDASTIAVRRSITKPHVKGKKGVIIEGPTKTARPRVIDIDPATMALMPGDQRHAAARFAELVEVAGA